MKAVVRAFSASGDTTYLEYNTETADMQEVNAFVNSLEAQLGGRAFDFSTGEAVDKVTPEIREVMIVRGLAGG